MPGKLVLSTQDLDTLTTKDLEGIVFIQPADPENWTEEHRLKLKEVVDRRGLDHPLDTNTLTQKLENVLSNPDSRSFRALSGTPTPSSGHSPISPGPETKAMIIEDRRRYEEDYHDLISMGGRPAFPPGFSDAPEDIRDKYRDLLDYWGGISGQRSGWLIFRRFQRCNRKTPERFAKYEQDVRDYREREGIEGNIHLLYDHMQQTKMEDWKEYHYFQHRRLASFQEKADEARQQRLLEKKKWEEGNPTNPDIPPALYDARYIPEADRDTFLEVLRWIEAQFPKIAQEELEATGQTASEDTLPNTLEAPQPAPNSKATKNKQRTSSRTKKSPSRVLGQIASGKVTKASKNIPESARRISAPGSNTASTTGTRRTRAVGKSQTTVSDATQRPTAVRRSQRLMDLAANTQTQHLQVSSTQQTTAVPGAIPNPKPRQKPKTNSRTKTHGSNGPSRAAKTSSPPQAKPQGISKRRASTTAANKNTPAAAKRRSNTRLAR
ncbi:hypothetical protein FQN50_001816 [Emmonsiellopsis sp. PD_5]|nr:hypothetical protein FQN50_001816 [Emmonsiellopsis sp. PD_5]